ncbi:MAG TPA: HNH endonuclease signature motif containing protein [Candidatus Eisenbacteria bacterium]|nr:HNH endonuclease signature motif containing protein [Candidatus Eisenbacteria bacterium]
MKSYKRSHLGKEALEASLHASTARSREATADQVADIGEFDSCKYYLPDHPSMCDYCMRVLHLPKNPALKRIYVARKARRFPAIFHAIADGRLHLTGVLMIGRYLREDTAAELLAAIEHKTCDEIERIRAERFPQPDLPTVIAPVAASLPAPAMLATMSPQGIEHAARHVQIETPAFTPPPVAAPARVIPLAPARIGWQFTTAQDTQDLYCEVRDLMGHDVAPGDVEGVLKYSLLAAKEKLLKRKCAATDRPRPGRPRNPDSRHIPAEVRRAVWERDGGQCTFTSDTGHRCTERRDVQFDHIDPYARDGSSSASNIRLLCRAHNQYEAERVYGAEFMRNKRQAAVT